MKNNRISYLFCDSRISTTFNNNTLIASLSTATASNQKCNLSTTNVICLEPRECEEALQAIIPTYWFIVEVLAYCLRLINFYWWGTRVAYKLTTMTDLMGRTSILKSVPEFPPNVDNDCSFNARQQFCLHLAYKWHSYKVTEVIFYLFLYVSALRSVIKSSITYNAIKF
jgi:hypothetical protein